MNAQIADDRGRNSPLPKYQASNTSYHLVIMGGNAAKERRRLKRLEETKKIEASQTAQKQKDVKPTDKKAAATKEVKTVPKTNGKMQKPHAKKQQYGSKASVKNPVSKRSNAIKSKSKFEKNHASKKNGVDTNAKKKKIKKPKHLARKMKASSDPSEMEELLQKQEELKMKKAERSARFKERVIKAVGGKDFFDENAFNTIMEQGGSKFESIIETVKISSIISEEGKMEMDETTARNEEPIRKAESGVEGNTNAAPKAETKQTIALSSGSESESASGSGSGSENEETNSTESENLVATKNEADVVNTKISSNGIENHGGGSSDSNTQSSDSDSDSDSSDNGDGKDRQNERSRGRKRKDRKEADAKREELNIKLQEEAKRKAKEAKPVSKKTKRSEDKRRCIGRKALTEFEIGQKYSGTVRYVKPNLGLFIDIGCHSDAFCHISRASDDFIEAITDDIYKAGDVLENKVRIVDIDRAKKRITVSLQSDERKPDEEKSAKDYEERLQHKEATKKKKSEFNGHSTFKSTNNVSATKETFIAENSFNKKPEEEVSIVIDPDNMTPAEIKRARKLLRRQERRKQQELTGLSV